MRIGEHYLHRIARPGDHLEIDGVRLRVLAVSMHVAAQVEVESGDAEPSAPSAPVA